MARLYYLDSFRKIFDSTVESASDGWIYLAESAFYPESGGQPADFGFLNGLAVVDVQEMPDGRVGHKVDGALEQGAGVSGQIDWGRRFDHMQQHTGQHLLSAVFEELFQIPTLSFHMGAAVSTIDLETGTLTATQMEQAERRANEIVFENRAVTVSFEDAATAAGLRKASARTGQLRIVTIADLDRSACGGTHVRSTGEIGPILLRRTEKIRAATRLEFVCGGRAVRRARADYDALSAVGRVYSCGVDEVAAVAVGQAERLQESEKARRKLSQELAGLQGRALYDAAVAGADGVRRHWHRGAITDEVRAQATAFAAGPRAVFVALSADSVLIAASKDSGVNAGAVVKAVASRGGGSPQMGQGSVADAAAAVEERIRTELAWPKESI